MSYPEFEAEEISIDKKTIYNINALWDMLPANLDERTYVGCGWILYLINREEDKYLCYASCSEEKKKIIDLLIEDQIVSLKEGIAKFSDTFVKFNEQYKVK